MSLKNTKTAEEKREYGRAYMKLRYAKDPVFREEQKKKVQKNYEQTKEKRRDNYIAKKRKEYILKHGTDIGFQEPRRNKKFLKK